MSAPAGEPRRPIRRLDPATVERIAAGEVVERPASVVKELVENSIDAGARSVTVRIEDGGLARIVVADDGVGIPPEELELAVERHATSKIDPEGPVERIETLGFRGEALAAIATVSRFEIASRPRDRDAAEGLRVVGGTLSGRIEISRAPGTTVGVEQLFFNTPARRKFLHSPAAEQVEVARTLERIYLAEPSVSIRLEARGEEIASYPATADLRDAASRVLGTDFRRSSFRVTGTVPGGNLEGHLGRPPLAATSTHSLYLSVNGRAIDARPVQQAVRAAFADYLPRGRFPIGVLHLTVAPTGIDVNVHPTKREIRFARPHDLLEAVRRSVRESLLAAPQFAELPNRGAAPIASAATRSPPARVAPSSGGVAAASALRSNRAQQTLADVGPAPRLLPSIVGTSRHPALALLGCVQALYWVAEAEEGLVLIDQHAASERVIFESLRRELPLARQALVEPFPVRLSGAQRSALRAHAADVARAGFDVAEFGPGAHAVRTVPVFAGRRAPPESVALLLDELASGGRPTEPDGLVERTSASLACHAAIRAGDRIAPEEFARVLAALHALPEASSTCPHGRPIEIDIPRSRLDRWFLRSGP